MEQMQMPGMGSQDASSGRAPGRDRQVEFSGTLERVVYHNDENGWTVFRLRVEGREDPVAVVGTMASPQPGSHLRVRGRWISHPKFGRQIQMESWEEELPATEEGIRLFLASGCIKGIGPKWADRIVGYFGKETLEVMDNDPDRMLELPRFGRKRLEAMKASWAEHQGIRELMIFLQPHGVTAGMAVRIFRQYGAQALDVVRENPYRLAMDIHGVGFTTADALARKLGFEEAHPLRAEAGMLYALMRLSDEGHVYCPREMLMEEASAKLGIPAETAEAALEALEAEDRIVIEDFGDHQGIYLTRYHIYESKIAYYLHRLLHSPKSVHFAKPDELVKSVLGKMPMQLAEEQKQAVHTAAKSKVMVLTGGPGTGKTTILNAIIKVFQEVRAKILLAAPTGRAAKRMSEASGLEAKTIHRLLEYSPAEDGFNRNENNPLACGLLVVDEASMMDTMLMYHLVKAAPVGATFILVGDVNQLPSVGPGNVLRDVIASGAVPVVELVEVFRQAAESDIICNAHLINKGHMPELRQSSGQKTDFYYFRQEDPELAADLIVDLVKDRIPRKFGFKPEDIQVLSPMLRGGVGVNSLNKRLQDAVNPRPVKESLMRGEKVFRLNDRVMQIRNNYDKDVFNGDTGTIVYLDAEERELTVRFDERNVNYLYEEIDELVPAYAISIHKSQGGEYPVVVIPIMIQHYMLLQRNLVYTAVTRGRKMVVLVGEMRALGIAVKNNHIRRRYTRLAHRLAGGDGQVLASMLPKVEVKAKQQTAVAEALEEERVEAPEARPARKKMPSAHRPSRAELALPMEEMGAPSVQPRQEPLPAVLDEGAVPDWDGVPYDGADNAAYAVSDEELGEVLASMPDWDSSIMPESPVRMTSALVKNRPASRRALASCDVPPSGASTAPASPSSAGGVGTDLERNKRAKPAAGAAKTEKTAKRSTSRKRSTASVQASSADHDALDSEALSLVQQRDGKTRTRPRSAAEVIFDGDDD